MTAHALLMIVGTAFAGVHASQPGETPATRQAEHASPITRPDAAHRSIIDSTGKFTPADLKPIVRPAFGPDAGSPDEFKANTADPPKPYTLPWIFAGSAGIVAFGTSVAGWRFSTARRADGDPVRAFTLASKLALGFGVLTASALTIAAVGSRATVDLTNIAREESSIAGRTRIVLAMDKDASATIAAINDFVALPSNDALKRFSDASASFADKRRLADQLISEPDAKTVVGDMETAAGRVNEEFAEVVRLTDEIAAIIESRMAPAAERAELLLQSVEEEAESAGDARDALNVAQTSARFESARTSLFRFFRGKTQALADTTQTRLQKSMAELAEILQRTTDGGRADALREAMGALEFWKQTLDASIGNTLKIDRIVHKDLVESVAILDKATDVAVAKFENAEQALSDHADAESAATERLMGIVSVAATLIAAITAAALARTIMKPIRLLMGMFQRVGSGDLTPRMEIRRPDEFGQLGGAFNTLLANMHAAMTGVSGTTGQVAAAATEIAASAEEMAHSVEEQSRQIGQVSAAIEEMNATIVEVASKTTKTAAEAGESGNEAREGGEVVRRAIADMNDIDKTVNESATIVGELGKKTEKISTIINVITDIAEQTNLLALNAAIEAARAGPHGRGFAVVADEVRKLAERTSQATHEVTDSINGIRSETEAAVRQISAGAAKVKQSVERATGASSRMHAIESKSGQVAGLVGEIAAAGEQQAAATEEISRSVECLNLAAKEASSGANQAAQVAVELSAKSEELKALVERFRL